MRVSRTGLLVGSFVSLLGLSAGCQDKVAAENKKLWGQNRELQQQLDEKNAAAQATPVTIEPARPPEPPPVTRVTPPPPPPLPPASPPPPTPTPADNGLAGLDTVVDKQAGTTTVNFVGDALFDPGRATLKNSAKAGLNKVAAALKKQYAGKPVQVQGHSDSDPIKRSNWASNQALSKARADAVRKYLLDQGVESDRVSSEGFGDAKPKDPANTATAKAKNRRVEIVVVER